MQFLFLLSHRHFKIYFLHYETHSESSDSVAFVRILWCSCRVKWLMFIRFSVKEAWLASSDIVRVQDCCLFVAFMFGSREVFVLVSVVISDTTTLSSWRSTRTFKLTSLLQCYPGQVCSPTCNTGRAPLIRSHSSARFCFELSGNSN